MTAAPAASPVPAPPAPTPSTRFTRRRCEIGCVGVDLGRHAVKVARLARRDGAVRFVERYELERPVDDADSVPAKATVREALRPLRRFGRRPAVVGLSPGVHDWVPTRLPEAPREETLAMLGDEAGESLGPGERGVDGWPVGPAGPDGLRPHLAVALDAAAAERAAVGIDAGGFDTAAIDAAPYALARAVTLTEGAGPVAVVDLGAGPLVVTACLAGLPGGVRVCRGHGFAGLLAHVAGRLDATPGDAAAWLREEGLARADADAPPFLRIADEIARTLAHFTRRDFEAGRVVLVGGGATIPGLAERFAARLATEVVPWSLGREDDCLYAAAAGYSLRGLRPAGDGPSGTGEDRDAS